MSLFSNLNKGATAPSGSGGSLFSNQSKPATTTPAASGGSGGSGLFANTTPAPGGTQAPSSSGTQPAAGSGNQTAAGGSQPAATSTQPKSGLFSNAGTGAGATSGSGSGGSGLFSGSSTTQASGQASTSQPATQTGAGQSSAFGSNSTFPGLAGSKSAQPAASNEPPTYTTLYEKYLKACQLSNQYLFDLIVDPKPALSTDDFKKILNDKIIRDKLTLGLSFYKPKSQSSDQAFKDMSEGKLRWPGKLSVSSKAQEIVKRTSEKLNLDAYQTFNLFELYFEFNKPLLEKLSTAQPQSSRNHELEMEIIKLERTIASQYYKERISLLECVYQLIILGTSQNIPKYKEPIEKLISELIKGKPAFAKSFWESYKKVSESSVSNLSALVTEPQDREEWILQNLKEEFYILKIFYILFYELEECPGDFLLTMMDYFQKQQFLGSFIKHERQVTIKAIFLQRQEYATMIADLCVLIILNCLNLNGFEIGLLLEDEEEDQPISKDKNPLAMIHQKGKEITEFLNRNKDNRILTPVIIAWTRLLKWYDAKIRDSALKGPITGLKPSSVDSEDYLSFMLEMKDRPLFVNANRIALSLYRNTMKSWVCLLAQGFEVESIFTYERLVDICCECLKERQNLERFWTYEFRYRTSIAVLLFELLKMFPFREAKLIKLVTTLLGNKKHNYVANVLRLLRNLDSFSCKSTDLLSKDSNILASVQGERGAFVCRDDIKTTRYLSIPAGTRAKVIYEGGKDPKVYQFDFNYNFWNVLYKRWNGLIQQINGDKVEFSGADFKLIKLVCKIIIFDNSIIDILETDLISNEIKSEQAIHIPLLLLNTLYYFQRLPQIPQNIISHVFKALAALQAHPSQSQTLAALIQLYPRSLTTSSRLHDTSMMAMSRTLSRTSLLGYSKTVETGTHPILEVFNATKRFDKLIDRPEKSYDTYISLLKFAYELFVSNEFIFDQYPNEKYIKAYYGSNILNINKNIQRGTELLIQAQEEDESVRLEILADLKNFIKGQQNQSLLYSTFIDDLLNLIYKNILEGYEKMVFLPNLLDKKWKIGSYLLKITRVLLQRYLVGLDRVMIVSDNISENPLLINVINHLNNSKISEFILKTLEVVIKPDIIKNNKFGESFNPLGIENKYWVTHILTQNGNSDKQAKSLRAMIANCLSCLETIVNLIEIYTENRSMSANNQSLLYQTYVSKLNVVDTFEKLLVKKELLHFYVNNDMTQSIKINIILALFSYINFDVNKSLNPRPSVDPQIEKFFLNPTLLRNSMISEEEAGELEVLFANLDPTLTKNIALKAQLKNNQQVTSVSALAIRILTKLAIVWEEQIPQRKPLLYEYITMISHPDTQFTSNNIIKTIVRELLCIFANYEAQYEDACSLLEMMIVCLHSQKNFVDLFLKNTSNYSLYQQDSFLNFVKNFFASNVEQYKPLLTKLIIFLSEVFQRETRYSSFVQAIRKDTKLINGIFIAVFKNFTPNYSLASKISDYCNLNSQELKVTGAKDLTFQLEKLTIETLVAQECGGLFAVIVAVRFLTQELLSSGRKSQQEGMNISLCIKEFFSKFFMIWLERFKEKGIAKFAEERAFQDFLDELRNPEHRIPREVTYDGGASVHNKSYMSRTMGPNTSYLSGATVRGQEQNRGIITVNEFKRYQRRKQKQQEQIMELEKEGATGDKLDSILLKGVYKILDINLYGYGKNFLYDTQEFYFAMMNGGYKKDFVYYSVLFLTKQNLLDSLITLEHKYFESIITLFKFTSTLGLKGQSFSSSFYQFSVIQGDLYVQSLEDVFENDKEKALANANHKITFPMGFPDFFTKGSTSDALDKKVASSAEFLERVISLIWEGLRQDERECEVNLPSLKALEQKTNFLTFAFNALFYLIKISQTLLSFPEPKSLKPADSNKMEKEKEKKLPLVLEVTNLGKIFKEIFADLSDVIWSRVTNISSEFTVDMAPYIIFSMTFLECVKELSDHLRIDVKEIKNHLSMLELSIEENTTYLSLIITYLDLLYTLDEGEFLEYSAYTQERLLKFLVRKISEEDAGELECVFIIKFFVKMAKDINGALRLKENNILWELCSNKKLKESHQTSEYRNGQRNPTHILWCWVLILMRQMVETLHQESGFMNSALGFIKEYSHRINYILSLPAQVFAQDSLEANKREGYLSSIQEKPSSFKFTAAYFEELECISSLLSEYFQHAEEWVIINRLQFELILYNITHSALKIFRPLSSIIGASTAITPFEKVLEQVQCTEKKGGEPTVTNLREITGSPFKGPARKSFLGSEPADSRKDIGYISETYNPSAFGYKIEVSLLNSLTCLLYSLKSGLQYSELYCYFDDAEMSTSGEKRIGIKYERTYWDNFALTLEDLNTHLGSNFQKWSSNVPTVDKISKKYDYLNNSVTCTIQNYSLNTNFQSLGLEELKDLSKTALSILAYNMFLHFSMFREFKGPDVSFIGGHVAANKERLGKLIGKANNIINTKSGPGASGDSAGLSAFMAIILEELK